VNVLRVVLGVLLALGLALAFAVAAFKPPPQTHHRLAATPNFATKSAVHEAAEGARRYEYSLAFVELDDDGHFAEEAQVRQVMADLRAKAARADTVVLLYVHGWNHDAREADDNVACFEELVKAAAIMQSTYKSADGKTPRSVYGVYVGWPGAVYESDALNKALTYFGRQSAADRVGERGALLELFTRIGQLRLDPKSARTKFVIVAHSLGGRLTYRALRPIMQTSVHERGVDGSPFIADVAVMVNPALSAEDHVVLSRLLEAQAAPGRARAQPRFIVATSIGDEVLRGPYRWSQRVATFLRGDYWWQNELRIVPIGFYEAYVTHTLELVGNYRNASGAAGCPTVRHDELEIVKGGRRAQRPAELQNYRTIRHYDDDGREAYRTELAAVAGRNAAPIWVVKVAEKIIPNHNDIFTSPFVEFVVRVVNVGLYGERTLPEARTEAIAPR
jgi:hypothetical protein